MNKKLKNIIAIVLSVLTVLSSVCIIGASAGTSIVTMKSGTTYALSSCGNYLEIKAPGEGYITVTATASGSTQKKLVKDAYVTYEKYYVTQTQYRPIKAGVKITSSTQIYTVSKTTANLKKSYFTSATLDKTNSKLYSGVTLTSDNVKQINASNTKKIFLYKTTGTVQKTKAVKHAAEYAYISPVASATIEILNNLERNNTYEKNTIQVEYGKTNTQSVKIPVSAGTYLVHIKESATLGNGEVKVKYTYTSVTHKNNYCKAKAVSLKANTSVSIYQTTVNNYDRWYKVSLSKKAAIKVTTSGFSGQSIRIVGQDGQHFKVAVNSSRSSWTTTDLLPAGTYYIICRNSTDYLKTDFYTMKWASTSTKGSASGTIVI